MSKRSTILIIATIVAILVGSYWFGLGAEFGGADSLATETIDDSGYTPWASPLLDELPGEVESGLFALQAGLGGVLLGFALGTFRERRHRSDV